MEGEKKHPQKLLPRGRNICLLSGGLVAVDFFAWIPYRAGQLDLSGTSLYSPPPLHSTPSSIGHRWDRHRACRSYVDLLIVSLPSVLNFNLGRLWLLNLNKMVWCNCKVWLQKTLMRTQSNQVVQSIQCLLLSFCSVRLSRIS